MNTIPFELRGHLETFCLYMIPEILTYMMETEQLEKDIGDVKNDIERIFLKACITLDNFSCRK